MDNKNKPDGFSYTYSAKEQEEIKKIREKYALSEQAEDKMEQLRRLDSGVTKKGTVVSLIIGILGSLIMGVGMSIAMTEIGELLGKFSMLVAVCVGIAGLVLVILAYPIYMGITKKERKKIAPEILRLTDELMK